MALGTIAAIGGIISAGSSLLGGRKAKKDAKKAARQQEAMGREQATYIAAETEEDLRRYDLDTAKTLGMGDALSSASGFSAGSSQDIYMASMAEEFKSDREWMERSSKSRQDLAKRGAGYQADALRSQGSAAMYQGIGGAFQGLTTAAAHKGW